MKLSPFPEGGQWRAWRASAIHAIVSAAGRQDDLAPEWVMMVDTEEPWSPALEEPGEGWVSLDRKLAAAITNIASGDIGRETTQYNTTTLNNHLVVRGRVLLAIVRRYYSAGTTGQVMCDMSHLQTLTLHGDSLDGFHNTWNLVLSELPTQPTPEIIQFSYFQQIQKFKPMAEDIAHYKRAKWINSPDYLFDWLWAAS